MKKRISSSITIVLVLCLLGALFALPAVADVVWGEPNDFFDQHKDECVVVRKYVRMPGNELPSLKVQPGSRQEVEIPDYWKERFVDSGFQIYAVCNYNGELWGFVDAVTHGPGVSGWIKMDEVETIDNDDWLNNTGYIQDINRNISTPVLIVILVVFVAATSAFFIFLFYRRKNDKPRP